MAATRRLTHVDDRRPHPHGGRRRQGRHRPRSRGVGPRLDVGARPATAIRRGAVKKGNPLAGGPAGRHHGGQAHRASSSRCATRWRSPRVEVEVDADRAPGRHPRRRVRTARPDRRRDGGAHRGGRRGAHRLRHAQGRGQGDGDRPGAARREARRPVRPLPAGRRQPGRARDGDDPRLDPAGSGRLADPADHVERIRAGLAAAHVRYATTTEARTTAGLAACDVAFTWLLVGRRSWRRRPTSAGCTHRRWRSARCASTRWRRGRWPSATRAACRPRRSPSTSSPAAGADATAAAGVRAPARRPLVAARVHRPRRSRRPCAGSRSGVVGLGLDRQRGGAAGRRVRHGRSSPCAAIPARAAPPGVRVGVGRRTSSTGCWRGRRRGDRRPAHRRDRRRSSTRGGIARMRPGRAAGQHRPRPARRRPRAGRGAPHRPPGGRRARRRRPRAAARRRSVVARPQPDPHAAHLGLPADPLGRRRDSVRRQRAALGRRRAAAVGASIRRVATERARRPVSGYSPQLDGLRAVAVAAVAWSHWLPAWQFGLPLGAGVHLFFVLSGFLITRHPARSARRARPRRRRSAASTCAGRCGLFPAFSWCCAVAVWADVPLGPRDTGSGTPATSPMSSSRAKRGGRGTSAISGRWPSRSSSIWCGRG